MSKARYDGTVQDLYDATRPQTLGTLLAQLKQKASYDMTGASLAGEDGAWINSLPTTAELLLQAGLGSAGVLLEYNPYQAGNGRADLIVTGRKNGTPSLVVVELKQWSKATWNAEQEVVTDFQARYSTSRHPYRQAADYADFISNFTQGFDEDAARVQACAFLHNADHAGVQSLRTAGSQEASRTFSGDAAGRDRFKEFLTDALDPVEGHSVARDLLRAKMLQSANILKVAATTFQDPTAFPLTPEQHGVVNEILDLIRDVKDPYSPRTSAIVVVDGRPGSGKTWICLHLLGRLAQSDHQAAFATNSTALRESLTRIARTNGATRAIAGMITSARSYWDHTRWSTPLDVLIVDEAQRISEYTIRTGFGNPRAVQEQLEAKNVTQLFELHKSARVLVLMLDEGQATTARDHLTSEEARKLAARVGADFKRLQLTEQHRSGGSKAYEEWVDALVAGIPVPWTGAENFSVEVASSPQEMERLLQDKDGDSKRVLAGFAWPWEKPTSTHVEDLAREVVIGDWSMSWNLQKAVGGMPSTDLWASSPAGAEQVGSVFSAQGFEFDYCGVIIGEDFRVASDGKSLEPNLRGSKYGKLVSVAKKDAARVDYIRNQYRVLLTRAMRGVVLYAVDPAVRSILQAAVRGEHSDA